MAVQNKLQMKPFLSIDNTTSTGAGASVGVGPVQKVTAQVVASTGAAVGTLSIEGSLNGATWVTILAASTFTNSRVVSNTSTGPIVTSIRARLNTHTSGGKVKVWLAGI